MPTIEHSPCSGTWPAARHTTHFFTSLKRTCELVGIPSQRNLGQRLRLDQKLASFRTNRYEAQVRGSDRYGLGE